MTNRRKGREPTRPILRLYLSQLHNPKDSPPDKLHSWQPLRGKPAFPTFKPPDLTPPKEIMVAREDRHRGRPEVDCPQVVEATQEEEPEEAMEEDRAKEHQGPEQEQEEEEAPEEEEEDLEILEVTEVEEEGATTTTPTGTTTEPTATEIHNSSLITSTYLWPKGSILRHKPSSISPPSLLLMMEEKPERSFLINNGLKQ